MNGHGEIFQPPKKSVRLTVNGQPVVSEVEPRLQLAELLREQLMLTGTHLGCEHGVCGACTVYVDGAPARSCITYAVACEGADVRTIEGFDDDGVMAELREAFSAEHALQCGYCTPGMLVTARDIVLRLPDADEARIRKELAGNLCRCTGYVGIVRAIQRVLVTRRGLEAGSSAGPSSFDSAALRSGRTEVAESAARSSVESASLRSERAQVRRDEAAAPLVPRSGESVAAGNNEATIPLAPRSAARVGVRGDSTLHQSFTVSHPRGEVWAFFGRLDEVTTCVPGATVAGTPGPDRVDTVLRVKLGPIVAEFNGTAEVVRDASSHSGVINGTARDARSSSSTRGTIRYALHDENDGAATRVEVDVDYTLTGPLAQFGRSGLVQDIAKRLTAAFAQNLAARLTALEAPPGAGRPSPEATAQLDAGSLLATALWTRVKGLFRSLLGR
jgi:aerobic carbon-monoxide dehydrogenase small subunit